jgi:hypothetical protein
MVVSDIPVLSSSTFGTLVLCYTTWYWQVLLGLSSTCILLVLWFGDLSMGHFVPGFHYTSTGVCPIQVDDLLASTAREYFSNRIITIF